MKYIKNMKIFEDTLDVMFSIQNNDFLEFIENIEKENIDINYKFNNNDTLLIYSCSYERIKHVKYLIENGADINIKNKQGETALMESCLVDNYNIVKYLIENGADINEKNNNGKNTLDLSIWSADIIIFYLLINNATLTDFFIENFNLGDFDHIDNLKDNYSNIYENILKYKKRNKFNL